jgi:chlorite dismutase
MSDAPNDDIPFGYALWAVLRRPSEGVSSPPGFTDAAAGLAAAGVTLRGIYDVSGLRADADLMLWLTGVDPAALQTAYRGLRRGLGDPVPVWNVMGVHREAEFSRAHAPAFLRGLPPKGWLTVYPFVRSYDWYLLPDEDRRAMLADHGRKGSEFPGVQANTVATFALSDYEWILALEADDPVELVDLMRRLRNTQARMHVREEVPFFTGRRIELDEIAEVLR